jgi:hypothetical protein
MVRPRPGISSWSSGEIIHPLQSGTEWGLEILLTKTPLNDTETY